MYIHTPMYIIVRIDERHIHLKGAEMTDKDLFARMAQSIIDAKNYGLSTLQEKSLP